MVSWANDVPLCDDDSEENDNEEDDRNAYCVSPHWIFKQPSKEGATVILIPLRRK